MLPHLHSNPDPDPHSLPGSGCEVILFAAGRMTKILELRKWLMYIVLQCREVVQKPFILVYQAARTHPASLAPWL